MWSVIGGPFEGLYRNASVIHDVACAEQKRAWYMVHRAFYHMMASGLGPVQAKIMYAAVYHFGPRWSRFGLLGFPPARVLIKPPPKTLTESDFNRLQLTIRTAEGSVTAPMTLEEIEAFTPETQRHSD
jgi:Protein of unknown function (DUF1353)